MCVSCAVGQSEVAASPGSDEATEATPKELPLDATEPRLEDEHGIGLSSDQEEDLNVATAATAASADEMQADAATSSVVSQASEIDPQDRPYQLAAFDRSIFHLEDPLPSPSFADLPASYFNRSPSPLFPAAHPMWDEDW